MINLYKPTLKRKDMDAVLNSMVDESIGPGERNREFAGAVKKYYAGADCVLLRSHIRAFELACQLLHLHQGARVALSPLAPDWYIHILQRFGCTILLADVEPATGCIAHESLRKLISEGLSAIIFYSPFGNLPEYDKLSNISIPILEDQSQGFGSAMGEFRAAPNASMIIAAFEEDSIITAGGGSALVLKDRKYSRELQELLERTGNLEDMPDLNAALGSVQLKSMDQLLERRREYLELLGKALIQSRHRLLIENREDFIHNGFTLPVLIESRVHEVKKFTQRYKIETVNPFEQAVLNHPDMVNQLDHLPNAASLAQRTLCFPLYPLLSRDQLKSLVKVLATLP